MDSKIQDAIERHRKGYSCSQAVMCTYCEQFGVDEKTAFRIAEGFGAGMGKMQETCGAVTGMFMVAGLQNSDGQLDKCKTKLDTYATIKELADEFKKMNGSIVCRDLLGINGKPKLRSCNGCIEDACKIIEQKLLKQNSEAAE